MKALALVAVGAVGMLVAVCVDNWLMTQRDMSRPPVDMRRVPQ